MSFDSSLKERAIKFRKEVWTTRGARFAAHRRLKRMNRWSLSSISISSLYVLAISIYLISFNVNPEHETVLMTVSIISSIGILVLSVMEYGRNYLLKSERLLQSGRDLLRILHKLDIYIDHDTSEYDLSNLMDEYNDVLKTHTENHERYDYKLFQSSRLDEFNVSLFWRVWYKFVWCFMTYYRFVFIILLPPILALIMY